jgi:hypothetical protein
MNRKISLGLIAVLVVTVVAGVIVSSSEPPESEAYLYAETVKDVPDDATVTNYENLSSDQQELYGGLVSTDGMIRINESVRSKIVPGVDYLRYDGELYRIAEAQN